MALRIVPNVAPAALAATEGGKNAPNLLSSLGFPAELFEAQAAQLGTTDAPELQKAEQKSQRSAEKQEVDQLQNLPTNPQLLVEPPANFAQSTNSGSWFSVEQSGGEVKLKNHLDADGVDLNLLSEPLVLTTQALPSLAVPAVLSKAGFPDASAPTSAKVVVAAAEDVIGVAVAPVLNDPVGTLQEPQNLTQTVGSMPIESQLFDGDQISNAPAKLLPIESRGGDEFNATILPITDKSVNEPLGIGEVKNSESAIQGEAALSQLEVATGEHVQSRLADSEMKPFTNAEFEFKPLSLATHEKQESLEVDSPLSLTQKIQPSTAVVNGSVQSRVALSKETVSNVRTADVQMERQVEARFEANPQEETVLREETVPPEEESPSSKSSETIRVGEFVATDNLNFEGQVQLSETRLDEQSQERMSWAGEGAFDGEMVHSKKENTKLLTVAQGSQVSVNKAGLIAQTSPASVRDTALFDESNQIDLYQDEQVDSRLGKSRTSDPQASKQSIGVSDVAFASEAANLPVKESSDKADPEQVRDFSIAGEGRRKVLSTLMGTLPGDFPSITTVQSQEFMLESPLKLLPHQVRLDTTEVSAKIVSLAKSGGGEVRIDVTPPDESRFKITLTVENGQEVKLIVTGASDSTRTRLDQTADQLRQQFQQMGMNLSLDFGQSSFGNSQWRAPDQANSPEPAFKAPGVRAGDVTVQAAITDRPPKQTGVVHLYA